MKKYLALVSAAFLLIAACENGADAPLETDGLVPIRIGLAADAGARSVLPAAPALEDMDWFSLYGTASGKEPSDPDYKQSWLADFFYEDGAFYGYSSGTDAVAYVKPGTWRFILYAYPPGVGDITAALKGTEIVNITAGFNGTVNFTLSPYTGEAGDTGSVFIYIELPEGSDVTSVETTIDGEALDPALAVDADAVIYENNETPVGEYLFSFALKDSAGMTVAVISDIVVVTAGAESAMQYALTDDDLNGPPSAPSDLAVESYDEENQTFHFTWRDNSFNETGFTLSDGTATHAIGAAAQSFDFSVADSAAPLTYTLKAVNSFGESASAQISGPLAFTVAFDADDGGAETQARQVNGGGTVGANMPAEPAKAGYSFDGWYTGKDGEGAEFTSSTLVARNITVFAKWVEGVRYELTQNPDGAYVCNSDDFLPLGFTVEAGERIEISFAIKTGANATGFHVGIGDWNNKGYYDDSEDAWVATGGEPQFIQADGQFHSYTCVLTALTSAPAGPAPLVFHFAINSVNTPKVAVYVKDVSIIKYLGLPPNLSFAQALAWIGANAEEGGAYTITLKDDETITPKNLFYNGQDVNITVNGDATERTVSLSSNGSLFTVGDGVTLTLGDNVTLQGRLSNTSGLVRVNDGGTLVINEGAKVSGNGNSSGSGGGVYVSGGTVTMNGGEVSGNSASPYGGGVYVSSGTVTMNGGEISGNSASSGGGVHVSGGTFTKQAAGGVVYGSNASDSLKNTATSGDLYGHAVYVASGGKIRSLTAGSGVAIDSEISGSAGGWEDPISDIAYSSVSGGTWSLLADGRRQSPAIGDNGVTKSRVRFTSKIANASITIQLDVSSEPGYDFAFISGLDNANATFNSGYYPDSRISGTYSVTVTIPVPTAGSHFIDIGYRKDGSGSSGSDCAWFKVIE